MRLLYSALFIAVFFGNTVAYAASCSSVVIKTADKVRSDTVEFWHIVDGEIKKSKEKPLEVKPKNFPLTLQDCGDAEHYFIQRNNAVYLVKKAKFLCIKVHVARRERGGGEFAGAPGSGDSNTKC